MTADTQAPLVEVLRRIGHGDEAALNELQQQTRLRLASSIIKIVRDPGHGEEILQDVYLYVWLHAGEYRRERGTPVAWLCMLARSRALDRLRATKRQCEVVEFNDRVRPMVPACVSREPVECFLLRAGLGELTAEQRRLILLAFFDGFSHSEIAEKTRMPLGTIKTKIRMALTRLRARMTETELPKAS